MYNWGTAPAQRPRVRFYLVEPGGLLAQKQLLKTIRLKTIKPGESEYVTVRARLPVTLRSSRGRVLAVIDEPNEVPESSETNNTALSALLAEERK